MRLTCAQHRFVGNSKSQLTFLGVAGEVTGSSYLIETPHVTLLGKLRGFFRVTAKLGEKIAMHSVSAWKRSNSFTYPYLRGAREALNAALAGAMRQELKCNISIPTQLTTADIR